MCYVQANEKTHDFFLSMIFQTVLVYTNTTTYTNNNNNKKFFYHFSTGF